MKNLIYGMAMLFSAVAGGCHNSQGNIALSTVDTQTNFKYKAQFDEDKTTKVQQYLDSALNNELPITQNIDLFVNLNGKDKFNLKTKKGWLEISFDKRNSSANGYAKLRQVTEGISKRLMEK